MLKMSWVSWGSATICSLSFYTLHVGTCYKFLFKIGTWTMWTCDLTHSCHFLIMCLGWGSFPNASGPRKQGLLSSSDGLVWFWVNLICVVMFVFWEGRRGKSTYIFGLLLKSSYIILWDALTVWEVKPSHWTIEQYILECFILSISF